MEGTHERLIRYLNNAWAVEKALVETLKEMAEEVHDSQARSLFQEHGQVTYQQEEDLEARIRALGEEPSGGKSFFTQMVGKIGEALQGTQDDYDTVTQDLMKAYASEHLEIAMYQALESYSKAIGDDATAQLARRHMQQEKEAAEKIWPLIAPTAARPAQVTEAKAYDDYDRYDADFRRNYETTFNKRGFTYEQYSPAYRYGYDLGTDKRYASADWTTVESEARRRWESSNQGTWEDFKDAVRYSWDKVRGRPTTNR
jgi:ferritin-like metal-binding protein YciE